MSEYFGKERDRKELLKEIIRKLHLGGDPSEAKRQFKELLGSVDALEISKVEQELVQEGISREEIQRLCEVHLEIFKESLEKKEEELKLGHPIHILKEEHKILLDFSIRLHNILDTINTPESFIEKKEEILDVIEHFKESEKHYLREENVLFPYLEKYGIVEPPAIMWKEHDMIRSVKRRIYSAIEEINQNFYESLSSLVSSAENLSQLLSSHFYKENNILFPTSLKVIQDFEWVDIRTQFDEIGYCCFTPESTLVPLERTIQEEIKPEGEEGIITLETGSLTIEELESILNTLPIDITFVDKDDSVKYFSQTKDRIFVRTKAVIGRKVQQCHPQKSLHIVNQIIEDFRSGKRDSAEFWINLNNRLIYIRYFAVRDKNRNYLGTLEVTQDITDIKKIEGEKRLLD
ncbi:MAG: DUF438 domain-containing protein [bacterium]|nr:DUF438 domain-containing protein [bacterium]